MSDHRLIDTPVETWGNTILYRLCIELDYPIQVIGDLDSPVRTIVADPDEVLAEVLDLVRGFKSHHCG